MRCRRHRIAVLLAVVVIFGLSAGGWHTAPAEEYTGAVQDRLAARIWETPDLIDHTG